MAPGPKIALDRLVARCYLYQGSMVLPFSIDIERRPLCTKERGVEASYDLKEWKQIAQSGRHNRYVTKAALADAQAFQFDEEDILECCFQLDESHFFKTMEAEKVPGLWQDVYKIEYEGMRLYVKIQVNTLGQAVVISFKEDTSW